MIDDSMIGATILYLVRAEYGIIKIPQLYLCCKMLTVAGQAGLGEEDGEENLGVARRVGPLG